MVTDDEERRQNVLSGLLSGTIPPTAAAEEFATISLREDISASLGRLWTLLITTAAKSREYHDKLVDVLVDLSNLPSPDVDGEPIILHEMEVWKDLPMLGWAFRDEWNSVSVPAGPPERREEGIARVINLNRFTALLMASEEDVFDYAWFAFVTFKTALETPPLHLTEGEDLDAVIPAAAAWIEVLGVEMYTWDQEFGRSGRGGSLWEERPGFCEERWKFWRKRFGEVTGWGGVSEEVKKVARETEVMMREIEDGDVD